MRQATFRIMWFLLLSATTCTSFAQYQRHTFADTTNETLSIDYAEERIGRGAPKLGLALAGGGTRAGHFAHGILQGLNDTGVLEKVDAISSVSGGSYAAYWYMTKLLEARRNNTSTKAFFADCLPKWWVAVKKPKGDYERYIKLMELAVTNGSPRMPLCPNEVHWVEGDPYRYQAHLARWPDLFKDKPVVLTGNKQGSPLLQISSYVPEIVLEFFLRPLVRDSVVKTVYHYGIERTWGLNPRPRLFPSSAPTWKDDKKTKWSYSNNLGDQWKWDMRVDPQNDWAELREATRNDARFPLWILNTTQGQKKDIPHPEHIYEMTAFGHGSKEHGFINESPKMMGVESLGMGTLASAAAADAQGVTDKRLNTAMILHKAARWGIDVENRFDTKSTKPTFHLSDGGGSENLGLYSLIKRGIPDIIVVDEAHDVTGRMDDLCWVKLALANEKMTMSFEKLEKFDEVCASYYTTSPKVLAYNTSAWFSPVLQGKVTWPRRSDGTHMPDTRLWLIKLGWNQQAFRRAFNAPDCGSKAHPENCLLTIYYGHNTTTRKTQDGYMVFPQLSTAGATYNSSSYLFWAYRELGRMVTQNLAWSDENGGHLRLAEGAVECKQPAILVSRKTDKRPYNMSGSPDEDLGC